MKSLTGSSPRADANLSSPLPISQGVGDKTSPLNIALSTITACLVGAGTFFGILLLTPNTGEWQSLNGASSRTTTTAAETKETDTDGASTGFNGGTDGPVILTVEATASPISRTALALAFEPPPWVTAFPSSPERITNALAGALLPLRDQLGVAVAELGWEAGIAVMDLQTSEQFSINGSDQFQAASTIKFFVALSMLLDIERGIYDTSVVEKDLYDVMVFQSNEAARNLTHLAGILTVNANLQDWGLANTIITHPPGYIGESHPIFTHPSNLTTPMDAARGLALLYRSQIAGPTLSRWLVEHLQSFPRRDGIRGAIPQGAARVFYKVGLLADDEFSAVHDIAIVEFDRGDETFAFALAVYTQGARPQGPAWTFVWKTARDVWDFFSTVRYPLLDDVSQRINGNSDMPSNRVLPVARSR